MPSTTFIGTDSSHFVFDIGYLIAYVMICRYALMVKKKQHMRWIVPWIISGVVDILYRVAVIVVHVQGGIWRGPLAIIGDLALIPANCILVYGNYFFWKTVILSSGLKEALVGPAHDQVEADSTSWPPAPKS